MTQCNNCKSSHMPIMCKYRKRFDDHHHHHHNYQHHHLGPDSAAVQPRSHFVSQRITQAIISLHACHYVGHADAIHASAPPTRMLGDLRKQRNYTHTHCRQVLGVFFRCAAYLSPDIKVSQTCVCMATWKPPVVRGFNVPSVPTAWCENTR